MIETSQEFKEAVYAPIRKTSARVTFDISDVTAHEDNTVTVTNEAVISRKNQLSNFKRDRPAYATFEPDYWKLDGSFVLPPKPDEIGFEVGWYSDDLCDSNGLFNPSQVLDFQFTNKHTSIGLTITFDSAANEYATDFDIVAYDETGEVIISEEVRGSNVETYIIEDHFFEYKRIVIIIQKWCKPYRRAKVTEVSFGVVRVYDKNNLIKMNLIEEINLLSDTVPSNELKFSVDNSNREFNILNPNGFYQYLQKRQSTVVEIGVEITPSVFEYVRMGYLFLIDWQSDEGSLTTTFTARNRIDFLPNVEIENVVNQNTNLYDLSANILSIAGVSNYDIDIALQSIPTKGVYKKMTYRSLLQIIAIAGLSVIYVDRDDKLIIKQLTSGVSIDTLTFDNMYKVPQIKLDKLVSRIEVAVYDGLTQVDRYITTSETAGGATLKIENTLINNLSHAQSVAEWIMAESNNRGLYEANWRQNPSLECGDMVTIEDAYGANKLSRVTLQEFEYAGYLNGKTKSKGAL